MLKVISLSFLISFILQISAMQRKPRIKQNSIAQQEIYKDIKYGRSNEFDNLGAIIHAIRINNRALISVIFHARDQIYTGYETITKYGITTTRNLTPEESKLLFKRLVKIKKNQ